MSDWLKAFPLRNNRWGPFFEDVSTKDYSDTEINADTLACYILEHPEWDPEWKAKARGILDWSLRTFANHRGRRNGASLSSTSRPRIPCPGNSHTSRHALGRAPLCGEDRGPFVRGRGESQARLGHLLGRTTSG